MAQDERAFRKRQKKKRIVSQLAFPFISLLQLRGIYNAEPFSAPVLLLNSLKVICRETIFFSLNTVNSSLTRILKQQEILSLPPKSTQQN